MSNNEVSVKQSRLLYVRTEEFVCMCVGVGVCGGVEWV